MEAIPNIFAQITHSSIFETAAIKLRDWKEKELKMAEQEVLSASLLKRTDNLYSKHSSESITGRVSKNYKLMMLMLPQSI